MYRILNNVLLTVAVAALLFATFSCENDHDAYSGPSGVYFAAKSNTLQYSFTTTTDEYIDVSIPVEVLGMTADADRSFSVCVEGATTTAREIEDFSGLRASYTVSAGSLSGTLNVRLLMSERLESEEVQLTLNLVSSGDFPQVLANKSRITLKWSNMLVRPAMWDWMYRGYFGEYSKVKHRYILAVLGWKELPESGDLSFAGIMMNNYFTEHEIYDENGKRIKPWM